MKKEQRKINEELIADYIKETDNRSLYNAPRYIVEAKHQNDVFAKMDNNETIYTDELCYLSTGVQYPMKNVYLEGSNQVFATVIDQSKFTQYLRKVAENNAKENNRYEDKVYVGTQKYRDLVNLLNLINGEPEIRTSRFFRGEKRYYRIRFSEGSKYELDYPANSVSVKYLRELLPIVIDSCIPVKTMEREEVKKDNERDDDEAIARKDLIDDLLGCIWGSNM